MKYTFDEKEHLHKLDGKPLTGTSSVVKILAIPLTYWASGKAVETLGWIHSKIKKNGKIVGQVPTEEREMVASYFLEQIKDMTPEAYLKCLDDAYKAHATDLKKTAKSGTDLHAELEKYVKAMMRDDDGLEFDSKIQPFIDWASKNVKQFLWSEAHCFDEDLWVGGISDAGCELKDGTIAVIDFKSSKEAYPNQFLQDAGYAIQIDKNGLWDKNGTKNKKLDSPIDLLIIVPFGADIIEPVIERNIEPYKKGFEYATGLYRLLGMMK